MVLALSSEFISNREVTDAHEPVFPLDVRAFDRWASQGLVQPTPQNTRCGCGGPAGPPCNGNSDQSAGKRCQQGGDFDCCLSVCTPRLLLWLAMLPI